MRLHYYIPIRQDNCDAVLQKLTDSGYVLTFDNRKHGGKAHCLEVNIRGGVAVFGGGIPDNNHPFVISSDRAIELRNDFYIRVGHA